MAYETNYIANYYESKYDFASGKVNITDKVIKDIRPETACSCYSSIFSYLNNKQFKDATIYIKERYNYNSKGLTISEEQLLKWLDVLSQMGFKFDYLGIVECQDITTKVDYGKHIYGIFISKGNNSTMAIKLFLNLLRYIYEYSFKDLIETYYKLKSLLPNEDIYSLIHYSNYLVNCSLDGHNCFKELYTNRLFQLVNNDTLNNNFINNYDSITDYTNSLNITSKVNPIISINDLCNISDEKIIEYFHKLKQPKLEKVI